MFSSLSSWDDVYARSDNLLGSDRGHLHLVEVAGCAVGIGLVSAIGRNGRENFDRNIDSKDSP